MKLYIAADAGQSLREAISQDDVCKFDEVASPLKWGKPSWSVSQLLLRELGDDKKRLWLWAQNLSNHRNPMTRRYATGILIKLWAEDANRTKQILLTLSDDENWVVRECAHQCWGELLKEDFQYVLPILKELRVHSSANLRRCVAVAARSAGNTRNAEWGRPLIELLEPLLPDKTPYVRKNLGSYAIGDGLLRCYPELTLGYLRRWSHAQDEGTRWNVAMAFASYGGNRNWSEGVRILSDLATDGRRYVWRAVASALVYLARRHSDIQMTLKTWVKDPKRAEVGRTALKYIKTREFRHK